MIEDVYKSIKERMNGTLEAVQRDLRIIRTGRASISLVDGIKVNYYGTPTPLNQLASLSVPEPQTILVQPYDVSALPDIDKSIRTSDLDLNPVNDGKVLRIPIPVLTDERRQALAKKVRVIAEDGRTAVRGIRREANDSIKALEKDKNISQDDEHRAYDKIQEMTNEFVEKINKVSEAKEEEVTKI